MKKQTKKMSFWFKSIWFFLIFSKTKFVLQNAEFEHFDFFYLMTFQRNAGKVLPYPILMTEQNDQLLFWRDVNLQ